MKKGILLLIYLANNSASYACADGFACAVVKDTYDHFLSLRQKADEDSFEKLKLKPYEIIGVNPSECEVRKGWVEVYCVPRIDGDCERANVKYTTGYVREKYISFTRCPKEYN